jgi:hypothetical protein
LEAKLHTSISTKNRNFNSDFPNMSDLLKPYWLKILALTLIQCLVGYLVFIFYLFFTWIFFGEGANSTLYTSGNKIVWALSPAIGPTILNIYRIIQGVKTADKAKVKTYIVIQLLFFIVYAIFTIVQFSHNGYRI